MWENSLQSFNEQKVFLLQLLHVHSTATVAKALNKTTFLFSFFDRCIVRLALFLPPQHAPLLAVNQPVADVRSKQPICDRHRVIKGKF